MAPSQDAEAASTFKQRCLAAVTSLTPPWSTPTTASHRKSGSMSGHPLTHHRQRSLPPTAHGYQDFSGLSSSRPASPALSSDSLSALEWKQPEGAWGAAPPSPHHPHSFPQLSTLPPPLPPQSCHSLAPAVQTCLISAPLAAAGNMHTQGVPDARGFRQQQGRKLTRCHTSWPAPGQSILMSAAPEATGSAPGKDRNAGAEMDRDQELRDTRPIAPFRGPMTKSATGFASSCSWRELERTCQLLDEANIRIESIDLSCMSEVPKLPQRGRKLFKSGKSFSHNGPLGERHQKSRQPIEGTETSGDARASFPHSFSNSNVASSASRTVSEELVTKSFSSSQVVKDSKSFRT